MNAAEWVTCTRPQAMLDLLGAASSDYWRAVQRNVPAEAARRHGVWKATTRKLHLLAVACCRRYWDWFRDEPARQAVEALERHVEKRATWQEVRQAAWAAWLALPSALDRDTADAAASAVSDFLTRSDPGPGGEPLAAIDAALTSAQCSLVAAQSPCAHLLVQGSRAWNEAMDQEAAGLCDLIRDIFGTP